MEKNLKKYITESQLDHFATEQKLTKHCKSTILYFLKSKQKGEILKGKKKDCKI